MAKDTESSMFTLDISQYLGPDGRLTETGLVKVRELLMSQFRKRFPLASEERAVDQVRELLDGAQDLSKLDAQIAITARSTVQVLRGLLADSVTVGQCVATLAQMIDKGKAVSGPHVFELGGVSAQVESARESIVSAMAGIEVVLSCRCMGGSCDRHAPPPRPSGAAN